MANYNTPEVGVVTNVSAEIARIEAERQAGDVALVGIARPAPTAQPGQQAPGDPAAVLAAQLTGQGG